MSRPGPDTDAPDGPGNEPDYRFTLANERTLLAWNRTAIALIAAGLGVAQFAVFDQKTVQVVVGVLLAASGGLVSWGAYRRLVANDEAIRAGTPLPPTALPRLLVTVIVLAAVVGIAFLLTLA